MRMGERYLDEKRFCRGRDCETLLPAGSTAWHLGICAECLADSRQRERQRLGVPSYGSQSDDR